MFGYNFLHNHEKTEEILIEAGHLEDGHVIVDKADWLEAQKMLRESRTIEQPTVDFDRYQAEVEGTLVAGEDCDTLEYSVMGLNEESGEVAGHWKKMMRDDSGEMTPERKALLIKELGDVMWYMSRTCQKLGVPMKDVAQINIEKLTKRAAEGKLHGSGDER